MNFTDFLNTVIERANKVSARNKADEKAGKIRDELIQFIQSRSREASHLQGEEIVSVHSQPDHITFVTSGNMYVHIEMENYDPYDTDTFELVCNYLSIADAVKFGIISDAQYAPLREAEDEERERQQHEQRQQEKSEEDKRFTEYLATDAGITDAIRLYGVKKIKKILDRMELG